MGLFVTCWGREGFVYYSERGRDLLETAARERERSLLAVGKKRSMGYDLPGGERTFISQKESRRRVKETLGGCNSAGEKGGS